MSVRHAAPSSMLGFVALLLVFCARSPIHAETVPDSDVVTPLVAMPIAQPNPVLGADDKTHLAYEFMLMNMAPSIVEIETVETLDADSGEVLGTLEGDGLKQMLRLNGFAKGTELQGGGSGVLFMDVALPKEAAIPRALKHRFALSVAKAPAQGSASDHDPTPEPPQDVTFVGDA